MNESCKSAFKIPSQNKRKNVEIVAWKRKAILYSSHYYPNML